MEDEQADAGRDCRTRLSRPNYWGVNGERDVFIFSVPLITSRTGNLTRLIHTLAACDDHTYIHTWLLYIAFLIVGVGKKSRAKIDPW